MTSSTQGDSAKLVLIASNSLDGSIKSVHQDLLSRGYDVLIYEADRVACGEIPFTILIDDSGLRLEYNHRYIKPSNVAAAWFRRPLTFGPDELDKAKRLSIDREREELQEILWRAIPQRAWLNVPLKAHVASNKLEQLVVAQRLGFDVSQTVVSNCWDSIVSLPSSKIVLKMSRGIVYEGNQMKSLYTTVFTNTGERPVNCNPFPGLWQVYSTKKREWRITVVGKRVFSAAIYTTSEAKDDWRRHQHDDRRVVFRQEEFPSQIEKQCLAFLKYFGLRYGAFDFIEDLNGRIIFLECNPNGQYGWLETRLGLAISQAIADELATTADSSK